MHVMWWHYEMLRACASCFDMETDDVSVVFRRCYSRSWARIKTTDRHWVRFSRCVGCPCKIMLLWMKRKVVVLSYVWTTEHAPDYSPWQERIGKDLVTSNRLLWGNLPMYVVFECEARDSKWPHLSKECQLYHSYHLYHSFISKENLSKSNVQMHTYKYYEILNSRSAARTQVHSSLPQVLSILEKGNDE